MEDKSKFMLEALKEARKAFKAGEIPVGSIIVYKDRIISKAHNKNRKQKNPLAHSELIAIEKAAKRLKNERLLNCDLYVTKEPCSMCAGAIVHARIRKIYIAARDTKYGACGTVFSVCGNSRLNHVPDIEFGLLEEESSGLLKSFFEKLRKS